MRGGKGDREVMKEIRCENECQFGEMYCFIRVSIRSINLIVQY